jgi:hypothetical protein
MHAGAKTSGFLREVVALRVVIIKEVAALHDAVSTIHKFQHTCTCMHIYMYMYGIIWGLGGGDYTLYIIHFNYYE